MFYSIFLIDISIFIDLGQKKVGVSYCILVNILFASVV